MKTVRKKRSNRKKFTMVSIPTPLFKKVEKRIKETGHSSVSSYITYLLIEIVNEEEEDKEPFSKEDEKRVKDRLRTLGYFD